MEHGPAREMFIRAPPLTRPPERFALRVGRPGRISERRVPRLLDRQAEAALVRRADAGQTAWHDLAALSNELRQQANVLVVDRVDLLDTEFADFLATEKLPSAGSALTPTGTGWTPLSAVPIGGD